MTSKEKAAQLVREYLKLKLGNFPVDKAVKCVKICVQEIIDALTISTGHLTINQVDEHELVKDFNYWQEVLNYLNEM